MAACHNLSLCTRHALLHHTHGKCRMPCWAAASQSQRPASKQTCKSWRQNMHEPVPHLLVLDARGCVCVRFVLSQFPTRPYLCYPEHIYPILQSAETVGFKSSTCECIYTSLLASAEHLNSDIHQLAHTWDSTMQQYAVAEHLCNMCSHACRSRMCKHGPCHVLTSSLLV